MVLVVLSLLILFTVSVSSFPIGINLSPLGGSIYENGGPFSSVNWDSLSTYVFIDLFKHCSAMYPRSTGNGGKSFGYQSTTQVSWRSDGYPASLPYVSTTNYWVAMCDIGSGGAYIQNGTYVVRWNGDGAVGFDPAAATVLSYDASQNTATIKIHAGRNGLNVRITKSSEAFPVFNVSIVPVAFAANYTQQVFQPSFLQLFSGFDHIRFTAWQKIGVLTPKVWAYRTTPSYQSQHTRDGVAWEHMLDLMRLTGINSAWFSFPLTSTDYNTNAALFLADNLQKIVSSNPSQNFTIYYEASSPEWSGDSDRAGESLALFDIFDSVFKTRSSLMSRIKLVATVSVANIGYIAYLPLRFGAKLSRVDAVAVPAQFGRSSQPAEHYNSFGAWDNTFADFSHAQLLDELRSSVLVAEFMQNTMRQSVLSYAGAKSDVMFISYQSGVFATADGYAYRAGLNTAIGCKAKKAFPCSWANTKYYFRDQSEIDAAMPAMLQNASLEQTVQDKLIEVSRDPAIYDLFLDFMERWHRIGGGLMVSSFLVKPAMPCSTGGKGCGNEAMFESPQFATRCTSVQGCPQYSALVAYRGGARSALPFTSADRPEHVSISTTTTCSPTCQWGSCYNGQCICFAGYSGATCSVNTGVRANSCNNNTGMNVGGISDWSTQWTYVDLFKSSRAWISQAFSGGAWSLNTPQTLLANGYPASLSVNQKLGAMMMRDLQGHMRNGTFVCLYDGDGIINFGMDIVSVKRFVGRIEVTVSPSTGLNNGVFLMIERTNPLDPIRNIRFVMPGFENSFVASPFHPLFLKSLEQFSTLRYMDMQNTNGVVYGNWSQRSTPATTCSYSSASNGKSGVMIEDLILLSNTLGANAWFNMPHTATDDYISNFATLVASTLRPDVDVYVEYSNEVWGTLFSGGQYAQQQGLLLKLSTGSATARFCFYMLRSSQIFSIWKQVFKSLETAHPRTGKLHFILGSQAVNYDVTRQLLNCPAMKNIDASMTSIAIAPYFGTYDPIKDTNLNVFMNKTLPSQIASLSTQLLGHRAWARKYNMSLVTYESGIGLAGSGKATDLAVQANRDPRMSSLYVQYFSLLASSGVSLMMPFSFTGLYSFSQAWGVLESSDQNPLSSPKYVGLRNFIDLHPPTATCQANKLPVRNSSACPNSCSNAGVCVEETGRCECFYGASGAGCEVQTYTRHVDLCGYKCTFDQGVCQLDYIVGNDAYYKCKCAAPYYGYQCSKFDCQASCNYNGRCVDADTCSCFPGYSGKFCEVDCGCNGHGTCSTSSATSEASLEAYLAGPILAEQTCICDVGYEWSAASLGCIVSASNIQEQACTPGCDFGTCSNGVCACWAGYSGSSCSDPINRPNQNSVMGVNIAGISYWTHEWAFVDVMKMSSAWISVDDAELFKTDYAWGNGMPISLRSDGYPSRLLPGQILVKLMLRDVHLHAPSGRYVCLYDGNGIIDFGFDAKVVSVSKGRIEFMFTPTTVLGCTAAYCSDNGIALRLMNTDPSNPVRNIRVIMPGFEETYERFPFHPLFLKSLEHFATLRFMDWMGTNNNADSAWSNRTLPTYHTQAGGVALEHMIDLANFVGANPWFCLPHLANDDYVRQFAALVRSRLRPDLKVHIEYSNEVWNLLFAQGSYAQSQGLELGLSTAKYTAQYRFYSQRSVEIFKICESILGLERLVRVMSTWTISPSTTREILSWKNASAHVDVVGIAPYFDCGGLGDSSKSAAASILNVSQVIDSCMRTMSSVTAMVTSITAVASSFGLPVITYEAGQGLVESNVISYGNGDNPLLTSLFLSTNRDARMTNVYDSYISSLVSAGVVTAQRPLMHFSSTGFPTKYGSWGILEYTGMPIDAAPKYLSVRGFFNEPDLCFNGEWPSVLSLGVGDRAFVGFPIVVSPRPDEVWMSGEQQSVAWDSSGMSDLDVGQIFLWRDGHYCRDGRVSGDVVWSSGAELPLNTGFATFVVPEVTSEQEASSYFFEIRGHSSSNFSSFFRIKSYRNVFPAPSISAGAWHCCDGALVPDIATCSAIAQLAANPSQYSTQESICKPTTEMPGMPVSSCLIDSLGCRLYRTAAHGKPITNCVAQASAHSSTSFWGSVSDSIAECTTVNAPLNGACAESAVRDAFCSDVPVLSQYLEWSIYSSEPTVLPTAIPTTAFPTKRPTVSPTALPSFAPTRSPSVPPSRRPTARRTLVPTRTPSRAPTRTPSKAPRKPPSRAPTRSPTRSPTRLPSRAPSRAPTRLPSKLPTKAPSSAPTTGPTDSQP